MASSADTARAWPAPRLQRTTAVAASPEAHAPLSASAARSLASLVSGEIIPRLVLAHGAPALAAPATHIIDVETFAPMTYLADTPALMSEVERLLAGGMAVDAIMLDLFAPTARLLGRWWEEDRCGFLDVTMGLWRLQELVRELCRRVPPLPGAIGRPARRALFSAFPGEQHDFGAVMLSELFTRHGWDSQTLVGADMPGLLAAAADQSYDVIGLTLSCDCHSAGLRSAVRSLRSVSRNARVRVIVGGRVLSEQPGLAAHASADGTASDARGALVLAERLVGAVAHEADRA